MIRTQVVTNSATITSEQGQVTATAVCPSDTTLSGGGFYIENAGLDPSKYAVFENRPMSGTSTSAWTTSINGQKTMMLTAYALCQSLVSWTVSIGITDGPVRISSSPLNLYRQTNTEKRDYHAIILKIGKEANHLRMLVSCVIKINLF